MESGGQSRGWIGWLAAALTLALVLPVGLAVASPAFTSSPPASPASGIPPLPVPGPHALPSLRGLYAPLPVVARGFPDSASRQAVVDYESARLLDAPAIARMFHDAWQGLVVPAGATSAVAALEGHLLTGQLDSVFQPSGQVVSSPAFEQAVAVAMPALAQDPVNAGRLNNAAVALWLLEQSNGAGPPVTSLDGFALPPATSQVYYLAASAFWLWGEIPKVFPPSREVLVNNAYLQADMGTLQHLSRLYPHDPAVLLLLLQAESQYGNMTRPDAVLRIVAPLVSNPRTAPLGYAAEGDALMVLATHEKTSARFTARLLARRALGEYDHALTLTADPGVFTGRSNALEFLGDLPGAIAAQQQAVIHAPGKIDPLVRLAFLQQEAGDVAGMRATAQRAFNRAIQGWNPLLTDLSFTLHPADPMTSTGYLRFSFGADGDVVAPVLHGGGGGGFVEVVNEIPKDDPSYISLVQNGNSSAGDATLAFAVANMVTGNQVQPIVRRWESVYPQLSGAGIERFDLTSVVMGARLLTGNLSGVTPQTLALAQNNLRYADRFQQAADLCARVESSPPVAQVAQQCAGESQYLAAVNDRSAVARAQQYQGAASTLLRVYQGAGGISTQVARDGAAIEAAAAAQAAGQAQAAIGQTRQAATDTSQARLLFAAATRLGKSNGTDVVGWDKLGDLAFDSGRLRAAIADYTRAIAAANSPTTLGQLSDTVVLTQQAAFNNRGIVELVQAQRDANQKPDCVAFRPLCLAAAGNFKRALTFDAANPVYLLNAGWVERLLGEEEAARRDLAAAVAGDPSLYPAYNDLGVLNAEAGNTATARHDFEAALAANPRYDLASWNLGVLDVRQGVGQTAQGQAYLAAAISENRSFRHDELDFKTDEHVYRYLVGVDVPGGQVLGHNYGVAAAALGWIAILVALFQVARGILTDEAGERIAEWWEEHIPELRKRVEMRLRKLLGRRPLPEERSEPVPRSGWRKLEPWLVTVPVLAVVTIFAASRTSPGAVAATAVLALAASIIAIVTHEAGHVVVARWLKARVSTEYWASGVPLAALIALAPLEMNMGPYPGHRVEGVEPESRAYLVYLGGPAANLLMVGVAYLLFLAQPLPFFRLLAQVQLAVCGYSLLPVKPLDGKELENHPRLLLAIGLALTAISLLFLLGIL